MSAPQKTTAASDAEEPVRNKLERASIDAGVKDGSTGTMDKVEDAASGGPNGVPPRNTSADRGRSQRKRSHDNLEADSAQDKESANAEASTRKRSRKRSREKSAEDKILNRGRASMEGSRGTDDVSGSEGVGMSGRSSLDDARISTPSSDKVGEEAAEDVASPKIKRTRHEAREAEKAPSNIDDATLPDATESEDAAVATKADEIPPHSADKGSQPTTTATESDTASVDTEATVSLILVQLP